MVMLLGLQAPYPIHRDVVRQVLPSEAAPAPVPDEPDLPGLDEPVWVRGDVQRLVFDRLLSGPASRTDLLGMAVENSKLASSIASVLTRWTCSGRLVRCEVKRFGVRVKGYKLRLIPTKSNPTAGKK